MTAHYVTEAELRELYPKSFNSVQNLEFTRVLLAVDSIINTRLRGGGVPYVVPVTPVPVILKDIAIAIARHKLEASLLYDEVKARGLQDRHKEAMNTLDLIASGEIVLAGAATAGAGGNNAPSRGAVSLNDKTDTFGSLNITQF